MSDHDDAHIPALSRHHGHAPERRHRGVFHLHRQRGWQLHPHTEAVARRASEQAYPDPAAGAGVDAASTPLHHHQRGVSARHVALPRGTAPLIESGSIATYDPASGTAMVRLAGLPSRLIGPAQVTACAPRDAALAGASCLVALLDPHNPADVVVVAVWPAPGAPWGAKLTQAGVAGIVVADAGAASVVVPFPTPYLEAPVVVATATDPAWSATAGAITPGGFTLTIRAAAATTGTIAAQWIACGV